MIFFAKKFFRAKTSSKICRAFGKSPCYFNHFVDVFSLSRVEKIFKKAPNKVIEKVLKLYVLGKEFSGKIQPQDI